MVGARVDQIVAAVLTGMGRTVVRAGTESERHSDTLAGLLEVAATEQLAFLQREASLRERPATRNVTFSYRFSKFTHDLMFTPGRGLWNLGEKLCRAARFDGLAQAEGGGDGDEHLQVERRAGGRRG